MKAAGVLSLVKYNENGVGNFGSLITEGGLDAVSIPSQELLLFFILNPDKVTREYGACISWPSGTRYDGCCFTIFGRYGIS